MNKNENQAIQKSRIWEMKEDKYTKSLAKNQVSAIIHIRDIRKNVLPKLIRFVWRRMVGVPLRGTKYGRRKPTETSVFEFSYLCVNSSLEELKKKRQGMFRWQNLKKSVTCLTHIRAFPAASQIPGNSSVF